jgi:hypothetical protein
LWYRKMGPQTYEILVTLGFLPLRLFIWHDPLHCNGVWYVIPSRATTWIQLCTFNRLNREEFGFKQLRFNKMPWWLI